MKTRIIGIIEWTVVGMLFLLAVWGGIKILLDQPCLPYEKPLPLTAAQAAFCDSKKPEFFSTLITETSRAYWTKRDGGIVVCMRRMP